MKETTACMFNKNLKLASDHFWSINAHTVPVNSTVDPIFFCSTIKNTTTSSSSYMYNILHY